NTAWRLSHQTTPSPCEHFESTTSCGFPSIRLLPFGNAGVGVAPDRIAPVRRIGVGVAQPVLVDLDTQARARQRTDVAIVAAEVVLVDHVIQQVRALVVVDADAL